MVGKYENLAGSEFMTLKDYQDHTALSRVQKIILRS